jgi:hypothetical protein
MTPQTPKRKTKRREWDTPPRVRVRILRATGLSTNETREITGVPRRTQYRIRHALSDRRDGAAIHPGRPPSVTEPMLWHIIEDIQGRFNERTLSWDELAAKHKLPIKGRRLKELMNAIGYTKCKACQKSWMTQRQADDRVQFALAYIHLMDWQIKLIHFSDEVHFQKASRHAA